MQAYAALYQWHPRYSLDKGPFTKVTGTTVLETLRRFARDHGLQQHSRFHTEVTTIKRIRKERYIFLSVVHVDYCKPVELRHLQLLLSGASSFLVSFTDLKTGKAGTVTASSIFVASGILGGDPLYYFRTALATDHMEKLISWRDWGFQASQQPNASKERLKRSSRFYAAIAGQQQSLEDRHVPSLKTFSGSISYAGRHQGIECIFAKPLEAANKVCQAFPADSVPDSRTYRGINLGQISSLNGWMDA